MANVQIRNVPDDVVAALKARAAETGRSLNSYLLQEMLEFARRPTWDELTKRIEEREQPYTGPSSAEFIREDRDSR